MGQQWVELHPIGPAGVPYTLANSAAKKAAAIGIGKKDRQARSSFEEHDQVWAVFDRDEHPRFNDAIALCTRSGVGVARSNPCFEVWLLLHEQDFNKPDDRHAVQAHLKALRPEYDPDRAKSPNFSELLKTLDIAEKRAAKLLERREAERNAYGRPSTTVHELTRAISTAAAQAMPPITYRPGLPEDAAAVSTLIINVQREFTFRDFTTEGQALMQEFCAPSAIKKYIERGDIYFVACAGADVIGVIGVKDHSHMMFNFVRPAWHRQGISTHLWQRAKAACLAAGNTGTFTLRSSAFAIPVYQRWGFAATGEAVSDRGIVYTPMRLSSKS
ncbi:MAG: GNAT family N-acetyltransferase [Gammaproteobacteria bacterium]|nr:GNAT family N-acetyltransferase [Gammaproteobacteria bacterium]